MWRYDRPFSQAELDQREEYLPRVGVLRVSLDIGRVALKGLRANCSYSRDQIRRWFKTVHVKDFLNFVQYVQG